MSLHTTRLGISGFTLVELVMTMVILGILAVMAIPRLTNFTSFDEATYRDSVVSILSLSRQRAIASRRYVCVTVTAGTGSNAGISLSMDTRAPESITGALACSEFLSLTGYPQCNSGVACPKSATVGSASFAFDPQGRPVDSSRSLLNSNPAVSISISNQQAVTIQSRSGYAS
jgi:MSHA pilin protein MshC